jgi:hypothetical protein
MKTLFHILGLFLLSSVLCACPFSSVYKLDETPSIYVEDDLLGKWATYVKRPDSDKDKEEPVKLILSRKSDTEYNIAFIGYLKELRPFNVVTSDSIKGTAFMSTVGGNQFLNINIKSQNFIAQLKVKDDKLSLLPLSEHFTSKMIRNNTDLRNCLEIHYKTRVHPMLDEDFCLKDMMRVN